jgi:hypothetical protein
MNRRSLIIKTVVGAISAGVFSASGWLMGAKTLTMPGPTPPDLPTPGPTSGVGQNEAPCAAPEDCSKNCVDTETRCWRISTCPEGQQCVYYLFEYQACIYLQCSQGWCQIWGNGGGCGSTCTPCVNP